jgi:HEAT repeat protein
MLVHESMNVTVSSRNNLGVKWRAKVFFVVALLIVAWLVLGEVAEARSPIGQNQNRLTPIQREIERQRQRLSSTEVEERRDALMRLGNLKRPEASRAAAGALNDIVPMVRVTAAHAIVSLPSREAVTLLLPMLKDKSEFVRREVAYVLGETRDRSAVTALIDLLLKDKQASVRGAAAVAVGQIGDETAVPALSQVLTGTDPTKKKKPKSSEDDFVLRSAVRSLGQIRSHAGVPALIAVLENSANSADTRREAADALGVLGDSSALPALQAAHSSADDPYLAEAARAAIRKIGRARN